MFRPPTLSLRVLNLVRLKNRTARLVVLLLLVMASPVLSAQAIGATVAYRQDKSSGNSASEKVEITNLELGQAVERTLSAGEKHTYQLQLTAGQFAGLIVDRRGIDVLVRLIGANGKPIYAFDSEIGNTGQEPVELVAETDGHYQLLVEAKGRKGTTSGGYQIKWAEAREHGQRPLTNLAEMYNSMGDYARAQPLSERATSTDDGILTALEATGLNLWGTKLVTLSACDTGVGEVRIGEGVYGLRRAFVLAGSESLVMSLWPVSDYVTRELMAGYYKNLKQGMGRGESLRQVQLNLLRRKDRQHPFYWASFIQSGEWANLDGKR
jgi:hypothetical protein